MSEKNSFSPLSPACVKNLQEKLYDKRKIGAQEVERLAHEFNMNNDWIAIRNLIRIMVEEFLSSSNHNMRNGGLVGLASVAIGLGRSAPQMSEYLLLPALQCLQDPDPRVKCFACEALYNIVKILKAESLPFFLDIYHALCKALCDDDSNVRKSCGQLDRMVKDIVSDNGHLFPLGAFVGVIHDQMYVKGVLMSTRPCMVSWLRHLVTVRHVCVARYTADLLDGLLCVLKDATPELSLMCSDLLDQLLVQLNHLPPESPPPPYSSMLELLVVHCKWATSSAGSTRLMHTAPLSASTTSSHISPQKRHFSVPGISLPEDATNATALIQRITLHWIKVFLQRTGASLLPQSSSVASAVLPCLAAVDDDSRSAMLDTAVQVNVDLMRLVETTVSEQSSHASEPLTLPGLWNVIGQYLQHPHESVRLASLNWVLLLLRVAPHEVLPHWHELDSLLISTIPHASHEWAQCCMRTVHQLCQSAQQQSITLTYPSSTIPNKDTDTIWNSVITELHEQQSQISPILVLFTFHLIQLLARDPTLLEREADVLISHLCEECGAELVYRLLAEIVLCWPAQDRLFATTLVKTCHRFLLTLRALRPLREALHCLDTPDKCTMFTRLYRAWCYHPVSLLGLCLLTQSYQHTSQLVKHFGSLEVTVDNLVEMDRLIQFIESPVFSALRLHLLDPRYSRHLQDTLYALLMCLPQTEAFLVLQRRLDCVPAKRMPFKQQADSCVQEEDDSSRAAAVVARCVDFSQLLHFYCDVQREMTQRR